MVPARFVVLNSLPRLPNGKIDRNSLPDVHSEPQGVPLPPRNPYERAVADVWSELLGRASIGVRDNFFEIGGHSLAAVRVHHRLEQRLQTKLRLVDLFRYPTVESLAGFLAGAHALEDIRQ
jgi:acyl carrier protein